MRTHWEKQFKTQNPSPAAPSKREKWTIHEYMLSLPIGCMKFLFPNCLSPFFA
jgi:hypothetical protein